MQQVCDVKTFDSLPPSEAASYHDWKRGWKSLLINNGLNV